MEVIERLFTLLGIFAPAALAFTSVVLGLLSKRLGAVTHMPPYYRWFYVAAALACTAAFFELLYLLSGCTCTPSAGILYDDTFYVFTYSLPLGLSVSISAVAAWKYWGWLLVERT